MKSGNVGFVGLTIGMSLVAVGLAVEPPAASSASPAAGAAPAGWFASVRHDLERREYELSRQASPVVDGAEASWHAPNRPQGFRTWFTSDGVRLVPRSEPGDDTDGGGSVPTWEWALRLARWGRPGLPTDAAPARLTVDGNAIEYDRGPLVERYVNDRRGLEQLFVLSVPPGDEGPDGVAESGGTLVHLDLELSGSLSPVIAADGQAIDFATPGGVKVLHYASLLVTDARGEALPAWMEGFVEPGLRGIRIVYDDAGAVYPVTVDPLTTSAVWTAESDQANANLGVSVATAGDVNGDGYSDVIVGAHQYGNEQAGEGRAYVYLGSASGLAATPAWTAESDQAGARFGISVSTAGDVNGDGYSDVIVGADFYDTAQTNEGRVYVYLGSDSGLATSAAWTAEGDQAGGPFASGLGGSVATAGDVNGDGYSDVIVGARQYSNDQNTEGRAYVYLGSASGLAVSPVWTGEGNQASALFGYSVATAGDVNGDGYSDIIVGAPNYTNDQTNEGRAFVYLGSASGPAASPAWTAESDQASAVLGRTVATAGDVNGDGYSDVIVGADLYDNGQIDEGRAFLYLGSTSGLATTAAWTVESNQANAYFGFSVSTAGDVNGDGYSDVLVGAYAFTNGQSGEGRVSLYRGSSSGLGLPSWTAESDQSGAQFGYSVATAGDVNGDGFSDVLVGAWFYDNGQADEGQAFVYHGSAWVRGLGVWNASGDELGSQFGKSVATAGDVNGDGYSDIIIGEPGYDNGLTDQGRAHLYLGSASGLAGAPNADPEDAAWTTEGGQEGAGFGKSVATAGDVNGDGYSDVIVGVYTYDNGQIDEGRAHVYLGSPSGLASTPAWTAEGDQDGAWFGYSVASAGDVNGDGYADVVVGAPTFDTFSLGLGRAYLYLGSASGPSMTPAWTADDGDTFGITIQFGASVATAGDVNGDGYGDVVVGTPGDGSGWAFLYLGSASGLATIPSWTVEDPQPNGFYGASVATAGDVNGDGYADVLVGAWGYINPTSRGRVFLYLGSASGLAATAAWTGFGQDGSHGNGFSVASAGDVNGDGYADILIGAPIASGTEMTSVYLGSASGPATTPAWFQFPGGQRQGESVAAADVNGDGYADVIVGEPGDAAGNFFGLVQVFYLNGGNSGLDHGLDRIPRQARGDGTAPIALLGKADSETAFRLLGRGRTPAGRGNIRLQWEVKPLGTPFDGMGLGASSVVDTGTPAVGLGSAVSFDEPVTGLGEGTFYHWRSRIVGSDPFFPRSPWMSLVGNNVTETKLRTSGCLDLDGDGFGALDDPSCASLVPDCDDQSASAWGTPGETLNLLFTSGTTLVWDPPASPGAPVADLLYDTLRSGSGGDFLSASCLESDDGPNTTATAGATPSAGQAFFYLTRAQSACPQGGGSLGSNSSGTPRTGVDCP